MKIAIFPGSFNPIHLGHLAIAHEVINRRIADQLWFLVSPHNPLKPHDELFDENHRLAMVQLAIGDDEHFRVSDFEFSLPRPSFTIFTLEMLRNKYPEHEFKLVIGGDNLVLFPKWKSSERIIQEFGLIVYPRPNYDLGELTNKQNVTILSAPLIDISATEIREKLLLKESISHLVPPKVEHYLKEIQDQ